MPAELPSYSMSAFSLHAPYPFASNRKHKRRSDDARSAFLLSAHSPLLTMSLRGAAIVCPWRERRVKFPHSQTGRQKTLNVTKRHRQHECHIRFGFTSSLRSQSRAMCPSRGSHPAHSWGCRRRVAASSLSEMPASGNRKTEVLGRAPSRAPFVSAGR